MQDFASRRALDSLRKREHELRKELRVAKQQASSLMPRTIKQYYVFLASLGAVSVERHITLDRAMYGSDQSASLEPKGFVTLVRDIRTWEKARGDGFIIIDETEVPIIAKLRRKDTLWS